MRIPIVFLLGISVLVAAHSVVVRAETFLVDTLQDALDAVPGDGVCATVAGECTLRAAVQEANARLGQDTIELPTGVLAFAIEGSAEDQSLSGDLDVHDALVVAGAGMEATTIDALRVDRVFHVHQTTFALRALTLENGAAGFRPGGGGIYNNGGDVTLERVRIRASSAPLGGGVVNAGTMTIADSVLLGNSVGTSTGGGVHNAGSLTISRTRIASNLAGIGGGIYNSSGCLMLIDSLVERNNTRGVGSAVLNTTKGTVHIVSSTLSDNVSDDGGGAFNQGVMVVRTSTISGNFARFAGGGFVNAQGTLTIENSTIANNTANERGGGIHNAATVRVRASLIAGNTTVNRENGVDCNGLQFESQGHNLIGNAKQCNGFEAGVSNDLVGTDVSPLVANLLPLGDNGGPTPTHALSANSPARDAGGLCQGVDQRGQPRPQTATCDIGALEVF